MLSLVFFRRLEQLMMKKMTFLVAGASRTRLAARDSGSLKSSCLSSAVLQPYRSASHNHDNTPTKHHLLLICWFADLMLSGSALNQQCLNVTRLLGHRRVAIAQICQWVKLQKQGCYSTYRRSIEMYGISCQMTALSCIYAYNSNWTCL